MQREDNTQQLRALDPGSTGHDGNLVPDSLDEAIDEAERALNAIDAELQSLRAALGMPAIAHGPPATNESVVGSQVRPDPVSHKPDTQTHEASKQFAYEQRLLTIRRSLESLGFDDSLAAATGSLRQRNSAGG